MLKFDVAGVTSAHVAAPVVALTAILYVLEYDWYISAPLLPLTPKLGSPALLALASVAGAFRVVKTGADRLAEALSGALTSAMPAPTRVAAASRAGTRRRRVATAGLQVGVGGGELSLGNGR